MIRSENAGSTKLTGGVIVKAGGAPETLITLAPGKAHNAKDIPIPAGLAGTLTLKYGPGTVPHTVKVRAADYQNPFPRTFSITVPGPGEYAVDYRIKRVYELSTPVDPKGSLDVLLYWRAVLATEGATGILGALDIDHPDANPGAPLQVRTAELATVTGGVDSAVPSQALLVPDENGHVRPRKPEDEGDIVGYFEVPVPSTSATLFKIRCQARRV